MSLTVAVSMFGLMVVARAQTNGAQARLVDTAQGPVRGYMDPSGGLYAFYNIPYAMVPGRYKPPQPYPAWQQPLEAIKNSTILCPQTASLYVNMPNVKMQDDCLIANIYVPDTEDRNLPVVVVIHGGGFHVGYSDTMEPTLFSKDKNVITVTFNYRVSVNGFLCLGTNNVPGNAGLKDQVAMLRWIQRNIANFGGNPQDVTVSGCSAGSMSTEILMLSRSTQGLFRKVIPESGTPVSVFSIQLDPLQLAKNYAKDLNFTQVDDIKLLEEFYMSAPWELLTSLPFMDNTDSSLPFSPCVERETDGEIFLHDAPVSIIKSGNYTKMPMLYGMANFEGLLQIRLFDLWKTKMNEKFSDFLPGDLQFESDEQKEEVAKTVKEFYFGDKPVSEDSIVQYIEFFTDVIFGYPMVRSVKLHVEAGNDQIYLYEYSYVDENTPSIPHTNVTGADHCDQTAAVTSGTGSNTTDGFNVTDTKTIINDMWKNFIHTSKPVPERSLLPSWTPAGADGGPHMAFGPTTVQLEGPLRQRMVLFWADIYQRHYQTPIPPTVTGSANTFLVPNILFTIFLITHIIIR